MLSIILNSFFFGQLLRRDKEGPTGVLQVYNAEYCRRGRPLSANQYTAEQVVNAVRANAAVHVAGGSTAPVAAHAAPAAAAAAPAPAATPFPEFSCSFSQGSWVATDPSTGQQVALPALAPNSQGFYQATAKLKLNLGRLIFH